MNNIIEVKHLTVEVEKKKRSETIIQDLSFHIGQGEIVGIVGESGSGKSMTALSIMGLLPESVGISHGEILFQGQDLLKIKSEEMRQIQGNEMSMIFQEPMTSLNPVQKIGVQVGESLLLHSHIKKEAITAQVLMALKSVGLTETERIMDSYPYELSGGMRQRVMIAMATVCKPKLLIADEPTTALDVTVQQQILKLLRHFHEETKTSILFISHDLNVVKEICNRVIVMYQGDIVEQGPVDKVLNHPEHDYTKKLVASIPQNTNKSTSNKNVLTIKDLNVYYKESGHLFSSKKRKQQILYNISLEVKDEEILGIVGESGCGKSTLAKTIVGLNKDYNGHMVMQCKNPQMVFQDPFGSLNPGRTLGWILQEPLKLRGIKDKNQRLAMVDTMLNKIGLDPSFKNRYARTLSGGQRQRISIGIALLANAGFIVADEPVSALDVTVQSQILHLLLDIHEEEKMTMIFISHDLHVIQGICHRVVVMYLGQIMEIAQADELYANPLHPYTELLMSAVPGIYKDHTNYQEDLGEVAHYNGQGCAFYSRCPYREDRCAFNTPQLLETDTEGHTVRCFKAKKED